MKLSEVLKKRFDTDVVVIYGSHGEGKTYLCNEMERKLKGHDDIMICDDFIERCINQHSIKTINAYIQEMAKNYFIIISVHGEKNKGDVLKGVKYKELSVQQGRLELINILANLASEEKLIINKSLITDDVTDSKSIKRRL